MTTMPANPTPAEEVVVPLEPTDAMWAAGERAFDRDPDIHHETVIANIWSAMLAARPAAPTQSAAQTGEVERLRDALENTAARWLALDTDETEEAVRGYARKSVREIKDALSRPEPSQ